MTHVLQAVQLNIDQEIVGVEPNATPHNAKAPQVNIYQIAIAEEVDVPRHNLCLTG